MLRSVRPVVDPAPGLDEVDEVLGLLALPMLGGVVAVRPGTYRRGAAGEIVLDRLRRLADVVRQVGDEVDDRY
ncbi:hypothetical protein ACFXG4_41145 [Nocardia sp. NPDC059246]|uniref:hypothetical protein n=1 Tax=unclassified Nocardia TaxID=2637762 RepID=UPI00367FF612